MVVWLLLSKTSFAVAEEAAPTANSFGFGYLILFLSLAMTLHDVYFCVKFSIKTLQGMYDFVSRAYRCYVKSFSMAQAPRSRRTAQSPPPTSVLELVPVARDMRMTCREVERTMERLGLFRKRDGLDEFSDGIGSKEMTGTFEEEEPSLDEMKEAFYIFDENCDGFIDAKELRDVLVKLGIHEFSEQDCRSLIKAFDENGDGLIDIREFRRVVERSFNY